MNKRQRMITEAVWTTLVLAYGDDHQPAETVAMPIREAVSALLTCVANLIAQEPSAVERQKILALVSPMLDRAVRAGRTQPGLILPTNHGISLPN